MQRARLLSLVCLGMTLIPPAQVAAQELALASSPSGRNNILLILADDLGNDKVGVYGEGDDRTRPRTPNIDELAADGVRFLNAYSNPFCSPTRATLLTGQYSFRNGIGWFLHFNDNLMLPLELISIPEMLDLGGSGYDHSHVGKWHLSTPSVGGPRNPLDQGFNWSAGAPRNLNAGCGRCGYYSWDKQVNGVVSRVNVYATTDSTDDAIARANGMAEPWFLYLAYNAPHTPFHYPPQRLGGNGGVDGDNVHKYGRMVESLDMEIGRLLASIEPAILENTTIIFLGDNGTDPSVTVPRMRAKGTVYEGGVNVPFIVTGPAVPPASRGRTSSALVNTTDVYVTVADMAGVNLTKVLPPEHVLDSFSILPLLADPDLVNGPRPFVYVETFRPNGPGPYDIDDQAVRDQRWKLIRKSRLHREPASIDEFYDLDLAPPGLDGEDMCPCPGNLDAKALAAYERLVKAMEEIGGP